MMGTAKNIKKADVKEFDRYRELKYILLWLGVPTATITILNYFGVKDLAIIFLVVIIVVLLVNNYLKEKEIDHLKNERK